MIVFNLAIRFLLEVVAVASLAYWGYKAPSPTVAKVALAIAAPLILIGVWAFVVAPGADNPLAPTPRILIGSVLLLVSTAALARTGLTKKAGIVAVVITLNTILMLVFPDDLNS